MAKKLGVWARVREAMKESSDFEKLSKEGVAPANSITENLELYFIQVKRGAEEITLRQAEIYSDIRAEDYAIESIEFIRPYLRNQQFINERNYSKCFGFGEKSKELRILKKTLESANRLSSTASPALWEARRALIRLINFNLRNNTHKPIDWKKFSLKLDAQIKQMEKDGVVKGSAYFENEVHHFTQQMRIELKEKVIPANRTREEEKVFAELLRASDDLTPTRKSWKDYLPVEELIAQRNVQRAAPVRILEAREK